VSYDPLPNVPERPAAIIECEMCGKHCRGIVGLVDHYKFKHPLRKERAA
jgi:hypothetical protein